MNKTLTPMGHTSAETGHAFSDEERHAIIGLTYSGPQYDIKHYEGLPAQGLQRLIDLGYADKEMTQNDSPSIGEILDFLKANPEFTAHGYIVTPRRDDVRVSIEGVAAEKTPEDASPFIEMFRHADEFELNPPRAWYD